jgi:chorismate mutase/prephenate dehydratase
MNGVLDPSDTPESTEPDRNELDSLRGEVDRIDDGILGLLAERRHVARRIAAEKHRVERPFRDDTREEELLIERLAAASKYELEPDLVSRVWEQIMADSLRVQFDYVQSSVNGRRDAISIAIQGVEGANSHRAALALTPDMNEREFVSCARFGDAVAAVRDGRANIAVLPIENTTSGALAEVYDLLLDTKLSIVGEVKLLVKHCLVGARGASISDLKTIHGHPQAVAQCSDFLAGCRMSMSSTRPIPHCRATHRRHRQSCGGAIAPDRQPRSTGSTSSPPPSTIEPPTTPASSPWLPSR